MASQHDHVQGRDEADALVILRQKNQVNPHGHLLEPHSVRTALPKQELTSSKRSTEKSEQDHLTEMIMSGGPIDILSGFDNPPKETETRLEGGNGHDGEYVVISPEEMPRSLFFYNVDHPRRGVALIFNIGEFLPVTNLTKRSGYEVDGILMKEAFNYLGFEVQYYPNVTTAQLQNALSKAAASFHGDADCFACVIMTHGSRGTESDIVWTKDGMAPLDQIIATFNGTNCPTLSGKPKLFFIQACRGGVKDEGQEVAMTDDDQYETDAGRRSTKIPTEADILLSQATSPGYVSFRNACLGSIYIRRLKQALCTYGFKEDILSILTRVNSMVAFEFESNSSSQPAYSGKKQMPSFTSQLTKRLCFSGTPCKTQTLV